MDNKLHFLIVDDDDIFVYLTKNIIEASGKARKVEVETCAEKALKDLEQKAVSGKNQELPDIILLDIRMPYLNGFDFLDKLKQIPHPKLENMKVCMLTSSLNELDKQKASNYNHVIDYITKPFNRTKLSSLMDHYSEINGVKNIVEPPSDRTASNN